MDNSPQKDYAGLEVLGALLYGFVTSSVNLQIIAGGAVDDIIQDISVTGWYPLKVLFELQGIVVEKYRDPEPILERIGQSMMDNWYNFGPGRELIKSGVDFLRFQGGSDGYRSVVRGPEAMLGNFSLVSIDEQGRHRARAQHNPV